VSGANFTPGSRVRINDSERGTIYVNSAQLRAEITAADLAEGGARNVTAVTPMPGGGASAALPLVVVAECRYTIAPASRNWTAAGGSGSMAVTAPGACDWTAASNADWLAINAGGRGAGDGTVVYNVAANNATAARTGTLTVAGQTFTVTQDAAADLAIAKTH